MERASNGLYPAADIETFADAWGPIYKFPYRYQPDLIAKYNVNGGSVILLPFDPAIRPPLRPNERLCHWKSNDEYIHHYDDDTISVGTSSILALCLENAHYSGWRAFSFMV